MKIYPPNKITPIARKIAIKLNEINIEIQKLDNYYKQNSTSTLSKANVELLKYLKKLPNGLEKIRAKIDISH